MVSTKAMAKVAAVATGLAMATSMLSLAPMAHAAALTSSQVSSILSLLSSFGADASTIANVQASLTGGTPSTTTTTTTTGGSACSFSKDLTIGATGMEVTCLQQALIAGGFTIPAGATGYFGSQTRTAVASWQSSKNIAPAVGYFGSISRAAFNLGGGSTTTTTGTTTTTTPVTGNGLKVSLATDSPNGIALVQGQAIGELAKFTFANPTGADIKVTNVAFKRIGVSADSTLTNVYLFNGAVRITDSGSISSGAFSFNSSTGIFTVPAGQTYTVSVRSDILSTATGQQIGVQLTSVTSTGTLDSSVSFPVTGGIQTISSATMGTVVMTYNGPTGATENPGTDVRVFEGSTVISTHAANLESITFENRGTSNDGDLKNFRLYVDGVQVGSTVAQAVGDKVTFDFTASPLRLATGTRVIKVLADIVGGSSYTYDIQIRRDIDARFMDAELGQPILMTGTRAAAAANTIASGTLSITKATNSPTENVALSSTNVKLATFEVRAAGEDIKIEAITVDVDTTAGNGMDNAKIFLNGVQIGSTKDIGAASSETGTEFTLGSSFVARHGQVEIVDIYGDAKTAAATDFANASTVDVGISVAAADTEGMSSGNTVTAVTEVEGNSRTISSSTLTASKYSGYGDQTVIAGTNNVKLGSFTLSAGSTEGVNVNTIDISLSATEAASITDMMLKDHTTGVQIGSTKVTPAGSANSFSVNIAIPVNGTKTIDVFGNIKSDAGIGAWVATIDATTGGTGAVTAQSVVVAAVNMQTITIGASDLAATVGTNPDTANVIAGSSMVKVGSFNFTSQYSGYTVDKIAVKIPANAATSVASVTLRYPNAAGVSTDSTAVLDLSSGALETHATATFTGMTFYIPADTSKKLDVYVSIPTIASGATSGSAISVVLDAGEGYRETNSAGTVGTTLAGADLNSAVTTGKGTMYVRKSVPTLSAVALDSTTLAEGSDQVLGRVKVTADAAGDIDWGSMVFTVNKSDHVTIGATTTLAVWSGSNQIAGTFATSTSAYPADGDALGYITSGLLHFRPTTVETIAAGDSKTYELRSTIGGTAAGSNNVSVSIANPQTTASSTSYFAVVAGTQGAANSASFAWSDWSDLTDHAADATQTATVDWMGDYLVKTLPLTIGNRSLSI
ncbi:MAG: peptidoglycan-binding protein [Candidatus Paceibacterota bacterium]